MIKVFYASEKTNSYRPEPWNWSTDPFPAFRGAGQRYNAFLAVAGGFTPWFSSFDLSDNKAMSDDYCKIIKTKKGTQLLVPCSKAEDERILLITARGGFRGGFGKVEAVGGEILWQNGMSMHCCPVRHIVARITDPNGYVRTETGRRCCTGDTEIYSWRGGYFAMETCEYEAALETGMLFSTHDTIQGDLERCRKLRTEQAESRKARAEFLPWLERINLRLQACGKDQYGLDETFFTRKGYAGSIERNLYTTEKVEQAEKNALRAEKEWADKKAYETWLPRFKQEVEKYNLAGSLDPWREPIPKFYTNMVRTWNRAKDCSVSYEYSEEGFAAFVADLPVYEKEYQEILQKEAKAKAERIAKEQAEEAERLAREAAKEKQAKAEAEAKELGLPSNIRIWKRTGGRTGCSKGWVISVDGTDRERDGLYNENSNRARRYDEGYEIWNQILPGELVIQWTKACTAAEHECEVIHRPETISEAQLERVAEIQQELEEEWEGLTGLASGTVSPSVGDGWLAQLV